jgi:phosphate/sulfate permease
MKKSERYQQRANAGMLRAILALAIGGAVAAWSYVAGIHPSGWVFLPLPGYLIAFGSFALSISFAIDARRDRNAAIREARWEWEREIRPRI